MHSLAVGSVFADDYRIVQPLAQGGMGSLYVAEQLSTGRRRALKLLDSRLCEDARSRERFAQEARIGARIESDHIVEVVGAGVDHASGIPWLAMELLDGSDLAKLVVERGPLPPAEALELLEQACDAIGKAHAAGIVHRDLKPENLFVARSTRRGVAFTVKVLDFGISKLRKEHSTAATATSSIGSPLWMAPEQAEAGAKLRPATDTWALGLIAFYLLTRRIYWRAANVEDAGITAVLREVLLDPIVPASERARELGCAPLPPSFDAWFARCVARDPSARFADAAQLIDALRSALLTPAAPIGHAHAIAPPSVTPMPHATSMQPMIGAPAPAAQAPSRAGPIVLVLGLGAALLVGAALVALVAAGFFYADRDERAAVSATRPSEPSAPIVPVVREPVLVPSESPSAPPDPRALQPLAPSGTSSPSETTPASAPIEATRPSWEWAEAQELVFNGRWTAPGYEYRFVLSLTRRGNELQGRFRWTRVGPSGRGTEWVRGSYDAAAHTLELRGVRVEGEVGQDAYRIELSADGATMTGTSRTHRRDWSGRLTATRASH